MRAEKPIKQKKTTRLPLSAVHLTMSIVAAGLLGLTGCQPGLTPEAQPDPLILTLQMTPAFDRLRPYMHTCAIEENIGLVITTLPANALDPLQAGLALRWGAPETSEFYAAVLGQEKLVFIVHPNNPLTRLNAGDLQDLYSGARTTWPASSGGIATDTAEVHAWAYPAGDDVETAFETSLFPALSPATSSGNLPVFLAPDPSAMLEAVAQDENALGFLPSGWVDGRVRILDVSELDVDRLEQPALALSPAEPQQPARGWLLCLQEKAWPSN